MAERKPLHELTPDMVVAEILRALRAAYPEDPDRAAALVRGLERLAQENRGCLKCGLVCSDCGKVDGLSGAKVAWAIRDPAFAAQMLCRICALERGRERRAQTLQRYQDCPHPWHRVEPYSTFANYLSDLLRRCPACNQRPSVERRAEAERMRAAERSRGGDRTVLEDIEPAPDCPACGTAMGGVNGSATFFRCLNCGNLSGA